MSWWQNLRPGGSAEHPTVLPSVEISHIRRLVDHLTAFEQVKRDITDLAPEVHLERALTFFARCARDIGTLVSEVLKGEPVVRKMRGAG